MTIQNNSTPTKAKTAHQTTRIATVFQTIRRASSYIFLGLGLFSPFLHLFAGVGQKGVLHWPWMASFLDSLGWSLLPFFLGIHLLIEVKQKEKNLIKVIKAILVISIGVFYMAYTFISIRDFSTPTYYIMLTFITLVVGAITYFANRLIVNEEERLKRIIRRLFKHILQDTPQLIENVPLDTQVEYFDSTDNLTREVANEY